ncbi:mfs transporter : MFS transporter OS=Opitutaceae bacterium TAV5 GN=OPIT5_17790 PE=4 SV=1: MFS_1 [Gemmata massiliana]|uniref:Major facilitator superfamily (MFS) profile domain-containing protein n=1 Tax=Gemmata massiliana TaxID=1210884 RepID=A0A6P2D767_9BACT|nr:MFS transporter [Gemmata massiliana]VTR95280.1 mfs transporter : MFS transporter OS=Opitutaceae bacterium TAV5 GN=OPIT5_17790 PE=4 SV=1: MFS_1 [Gemmata massiliana]
MSALSPAPSLVRLAWLAVVLLWPVALLNYLDRQMLASMKFSVMADIPTIQGDAGWGFMLGQFKWVYAFLSPIGGFVADRFSRRFTICGSLFVWSAVTWATGRVTTYDELLVARALMGISEAFYMPAALALIADYHTGHTRSRAIGLHQTAIYCGVIAGGFGGYAADAPDFGWRGAFNICGIFGMLYAVPLVLMLRDTPRKATVVESTPKVSPVQAVTELLGNVSFVLLVLYFTLPALAGWVVRDWMPAILKKQFDIGQGKAGVAATLYWQSAALVGAFVGGWLADRWMRTNERGRIFVSAIGMCFIVPAMFGVGNAGTLGVAIAFLVLFGLGWGFFDCNNMPILCQIVRPELRATGYGIMNLVSISCGGLADWGFGEMRDRNVPLNIIFSVFASFAVFSIVLVLLIRPRCKSADEV